MDNSVSSDRRPKLSTQKKELLDISCQSNPIRVCLITGQFICSMFLEVQVKQPES